MEEGIKDNIQGDGESYRKGKEGEITEKAYLKKRQELKDQLDSLADD